MDPDLATPELEPISSPNGIGPKQRVIVSGSWNECEATGLRSSQAGTSEQEHWPPSLAWANSGSLVVGIVFDAEVKVLKNR